ncbi:hypothetical protein WA026_020123 [Henosepilachna vigintioctopunctata]|uniref:Uncharacterized protein n=1 Tax=Henosepilachna vigintioctopunctata TaxID=420089 RepID=A0AAW1UB00_9CUCU
MENLKVVDFRKHVEVGQYVFGDESVNKEKRKRTEKKQSAPKEPVSVFIADKIVRPVFGDERWTIFIPTKGNNQRRTSNSNLIVAFYEIEKEYLVSSENLAKCPDKDKITRKSVEKNVKILSIQYTSSIFTAFSDSIVIAASGSYFFISTL